MRVGVVGCGPIADSYVSAAKRFPGLHFVACAGRGASSERAEALAARHGLRALGYEEMLTRDIVDVVLVLTPAHAHVDPALRAIAAGKHVYCEKPLATSVEDARAIVAAAAARGVALGCAPDTVLGANIQTAAAIIEAGEIGIISSGLAALCSRGMEHWHPDPAHLYQVGGGPVLDKGPYYVAALVTLLGPVASVRAEGTRPFDRRTITAPASSQKGRSFEVGVLTTVHTTIRFRSDAIVTFLASWDVAGHAVPQLELYGSAGSVRLDDPNWFGGPINVHVADAWQRRETSEHALGALTMRDVAGNPRADHRGIGLAEMVDSLGYGGTPLCSGAFALHVLDTLTAILTSTETGEAVVVHKPDAGFALPRLEEARARRLAPAG